jgi:hypothetical protein
VASKTALTVSVRIEGVRETLGAFRRLPKEASDDLRRRTLELADVLAGRMAGAARADSAQSALMAPTLKAVRDRVPAITAGGATRVGRNSVPAYKIIFGSEFGSTILRQYRPHLGRGSYWMWRTVEANQVEIAGAWDRVARDVVDSFGRAP